MPAINPKPPMSIRLPGELKAWLEAVSAATGIPQSRIIANALREYRDQMQKEQLQSEQVQTQPAQPMQSDQVQ